MIKYLGSFFICLLFIFSVSHYALAENNAVIINQVRGESCCSAGSLESTKTQLDTITSLGLKASFAIRYDAITDLRYAELLRGYSTRYPDSIQLAGMIEIVPKLAEDAGVEYKANDDNWYHAQFAFTVGYDTEDRRKLIDTYMSRFRSTFGYFPQVTSSWMIDTHSANYLHTHYGVITHQITREQWGIDSYTLYGGPFHYPYPASQKWIFLPDYEQKNPLLVMRQTVTDPVRNYGDTSSSFTSQPNDYMRGGMDIIYFEKLVTNAFSQPNGQKGFVLLGLENSMNSEHQQEYVRQLGWLASNLEKYSASNLLASDNNLIDLFSQMSISVYHGNQNEANQSWNITTQKYRARLISKDNSLLMTDIRYYNKDMEDPYTWKVAKHEAFWVVPFVLDGSRWYMPKDGYATGHAFMSPRNDMASVPSRMVIDVSGTGTYTTNINEIYLIIRDNSGAAVAKFSDDNIEINGRQKVILEVPVLHPVKYGDPGIKDIGYFKFIQNDTKEIYGFNILCTSSCIYEPSRSDVKDLARIFDTHYPYFYPEPVERVLDIKNSKISIHNRFAIAGRNPVRLLLEPHDSMNFPILLESDAVISTDSKEVSVVTLGNLKKSQYQYVDFYSGKPLSSEISLSMGDRPPYFSKKLRVFFAPNCKTDISYCITHPIESVWYVITKISDWWSGRK